MHVSIISCALDAYAKYYIILTLLQGNFDHMAEVRCVNLAVNLTGHWKRSSYVKSLFSG